MNEDDFPIDVVFTWVTNTPEIMHSRRMYSSILDNNTDSNQRNRFDEIGELRFAIRSIFQYAAWVRQIFIVVDDTQQPDWLDIDNISTINIPIHIIKHTTIFTDHPAHLPTFNSQAIECHLHQIPNLSEHFIYFNDDMFLGSNCTKEDFFSSDRMPKYTFDGMVTKPPKTRTMSMHRQAWINNRSVLNMLFGSQLSENLKYPSHNAIPMLKSSFQWLWGNIAPILMTTSASKFRRQNNVYVIGLLVYVNIKRGFARLGNRSRIYVEIKNTSNIMKSLAQILHTRPKQFCLNDCLQTNDMERFKIMKIILTFLNRYFPTPTIAEIISTQEEIHLPIPLHQPKKRPRPRPVRLPWHP